MNNNNLKLKMGLECHQQLSTTKLFCRCNTTLQEKNEEIQIKRKQRAVSGGTGKKDVAALFEEQKDRTFIYHGFEDEYCLVCLDEEPIHNINKRALETALTLAKLLNLKIPKELKVMRKIISDGSVTSAFQRTLIIGTESKNSFIKTSQGKVKVNQLSLEEDACKKIKSEGNHVHYSLSRLGIPLLELTTNPDIKTPEQAKETAEIIGMMLRSFETTRRGIGSIRQDINLSIKNGARVELKGFQNLRQMPQVIKKEIERQLYLIKENKKIKEEVRRVKSDNTTEFLRPLSGSARFYPETDAVNININKKLLSKIKIPELIEEKSLKLEKEFSLPMELAKGIIENKINLHELAKKYPRISPKFIAQIIIEMPKELKARFNLNYDFKQHDFEKILKLTNKNNLQKEAVLDILAKIAGNKKINIDDYKQISFEKIEQEIKLILEKQPNITENAIMGIIMKKSSGKINPKDVFELIKKII
ncbi:hypothetical protein HYX17_04235 [Candidatus Woesearchaeota archaeon]|nr:hypothetical protein [Candidatus Woesearchaeota archaeon]